MTSDTLVIVVFALFGWQTLAAGVGWTFNVWRDFQEMREALFEDDDEPVSGTA